MILCRVYHTTQTKLGYEPEEIQSRKGTTHHCSPHGCHKSGHCHCSGFAFLLFPVLLRKYPSSCVLCTLLPAFVCVFPLVWLASLTLLVTPVSCYPRASLIFCQLVFVDLSSVSSVSSVFFYILAIFWSPCGFWICYVCSSGLVFCCWSASFFFSTPCFIIKTLKLIQFCICVSVWAQILCVPVSTSV